MPLEMNIELNKFELERLRRKLEQTQGAVGITTQWLVWDTARLAAKDAVKFTAPWADGVPGIGSKQRQVGESAVNNDLERIFATKDESKYVFFINKGNGKQYAKNRASGLVFEIAPELFNVDIKRMHMDKRNAKGRVPRQKRQAWVESKPLKDYIKSVKTRVGSLKASWLPAEEYFARKVGVIAKAAAWITKQRKFGGYTDSVNPSGNGAVVISNSAAHNLAIRKDTISFIEKQRQKFLSSTGEKRMAQIAAQFNRQNNVQPIRQAA